MQDLFIVIGLAVPILILDYQLFGSWNMGEVLKVLALLMGIPGLFATYFIEIYTNYQFKNDKDKRILTESLEPVIDKDFPTESDDDENKVYICHI